MDEVPISSGEMTGSNSNSYLLYEDYVVFPQYAKTSSIGEMNMLQGPFEPGSGRVRGTGHVLYMTAAVGKNHSSFCRAKCPSFDDADQQRTARPCMLQRWHRKIQLLESSECECECEMLRQKADTR